MLKNFLSKVIQEKDLYVSFIFYYDDELFKELFATTT